MIPATGGHGTSLLGAVFTYALTTGATVMDGETGGEFLLALATGVDVLIWDPVGWACSIFHQACTHRKGNIKQPLTF